MNDVIRNWASNVEFRPAHVHRPSTLDELRRIVSECRSVRVLGTGHSFNRIADTSGDMVLVDGLPPEIHIDEEAHTARVAAGMRLADIAARLHTAGYALANLPSLPHISLAGACATGTHGSGDKNQGLAGMVRAVQMIGAGGDLIELTREDSADFPGSVVALGALGIVTNLTVNIEPTYNVAQHVYEQVPLDGFIEHHEEVFGSGYSVSAFTDWAGGHAAIWRKVRVSGDDNDNENPVEALGGRRATQAIHPVPGMPAENCTEQGAAPGPWHERLPHFRPEFTPSSGRELQSEFFVPRAAAATALAAIRKLGQLIAPVLQISEVRTIAADDLWLSPSSGRDSLAIHFTWIADRTAVELVLKAVEHELLPLGARPHWGKFYTGGPAAALETYERADGFRRLRDTFDPAGKFRNPFIDRLFPPAP